MIAFVVVLVCAFAFVCASVVVAVVVRLVSSFASADAFSAAVVAVADIDALSLWVASLLELHSATKQLEE